MNLKTNKIIEKAEKDGWRIIYDAPYVGDLYRMSMWDPSGVKRLVKMVESTNVIPHEAIIILLEYYWNTEDLKNKPEVDIPKIPVTEEENIEVKLHNTTDAQVWTDDFFKTFGKVYPDIIYYINSLLPKERRESFKEWVFGWFCNAIQTGIDLTNNERNKQYIYILQSNSGDIVDIYTYEPYEQDINSSYRFHYNIDDETPIDASKKCLLIRYNKHKGMQYWNGKAEPETKYNWKNV